MKLNITPVIEEMITEERAILYYTLSTAQDAYLFQRITYSAECYCSEWDALIDSLTKEHEAVGVIEVELFPIYGGAMLGRIIIPAVMAEQVKEYIHNQDFEMDSHGTIVKVYNEPQDVYAGQDTYCRDCGNPEDICICSLLHN